MSNLQYTDQVLESLSDFEIAIAQHTDRHNAHKHRINQDREVAIKLGQQVTSYIFLNKAFNEGNEPTLVKTRKLSNALTAIMATKDLLKMLDRQEKELDRLRECELRVVGGMAEIVLEISREEPR